ncbi:hypothetical protein G7054_g10972 [Neopestalotiopsis clavispora]|nr:hypothetical protein G7054_g10972 [Neopestalotiopsis clavispora]
MFGILPDLAPRDVSPPVPLNHATFHVKVNRLTIIASPTPYGTHRRALRSLRQPEHTIHINRFPAAAPAAPRTNTPTTTTPRTNSAATMPTSWSARPSPACATTSRTPSAASTTSPASAAAG